MIEPTAREREKYQLHRHCQGVWDVFVNCAPTQNILSYSIKVRPNKNTPWILDFKYDDERLTTAENESPQLSILV